MAIPLSPSSSAPSDRESASATAPVRVPLRRRLAPFARPLLAAELGTCQIMATSLLFSFEAAVPAWQHPAYWLRHLELLVIVAAVAFALLAFPRRAEVGTLWRETATAKSWRWPLVLNLVLFVVLTASTIAVSLAALMAPARQPPWHLLWLYFIPVLATGASLVWLAAPIAFWRGLFTRMSGEIAAAIGVGIVLLLLGALAREGWQTMAAVTLDLVHRVLTLYETGVAVDSARQAVTVGRFTVVIDQSCSGYEGMALVATFLALFLWVFRAVLRFPNALLLLPIGLAAILTLNVLRIAALVSLGAHVSPEMAANGFHSQAGWMAFLVVTIAIMAIAPRVAFFAASTPARASRAPHAVATSPAISDGDREMLGLLVPFMALMAGAILVSSSAPYDNQLYGLKIAAAAVALWLLRDVWQPRITKPGMSALSVGVGVGVIWIATGPFVGDTALSAWLMTQPAWLAASWIALRAAGGILVVPLVEELAFRGLLYRWVISRRFEAVPATQLSLAALGVSSLLFGLMHQRWIAGAAAGIVFALLMVRSGRLSDAIWAHIAANAVIIGWALLSGQWGQL